MGLEKHKARTKSDRLIEAIEALTTEVQELRAMVMSAQTAICAVKVQEIAKQ